MAKDEERIEQLGEITDQPLHIQVRKKIQKTMAEMQVGDRLPSERQISHDLQVAPVTVRRAMCDLANEGFLVRHPGRGTFIRKVYRGGAAHSGKSRTIAFVVPTTEMVSHSRIIAAVEEAAKDNGCQLLVCNCDNSTTHEETILRRLRDQQLAGILVTPFFENSLSEQYAKFMTELSESETPLVLIDQYLPGVPTRAVLTNHMQSGYMITEHLIMLGHTKICFASTGSYDVSGKAAQNGYRRALDDYEISYDPNLVIELPIVMCAAPTRQRVYEKLRENPRTFSAFASTQFSMTFGAMKAFEDLSIRVPEDMAVVGGEMYQNPDLEYITYIKQPLAEMGRKAVEVLLGGDDKSSLKRHILLRPSLEIGETCGLRRRAPGSPARGPLPAIEESLPEPNTEQKQPAE